MFKDSETEYVKPLSKFIRKLEINEENKEQACSDFIRSYNLPRLKYYFIKKFGVRLDDINDSEWETTYNALKKELSHEFTSQSCRKLIFHCLSGCDYQELKRCINDHSKKLTNDEQLELVLLRMRYDLALRNTRSLYALYDRLSQLVVDNKDWEVQIKYKIYSAIYYLITQDYRRASEILTDSFLTFNSDNLLDYTDILCYTLLSSILSLSRTDLNKLILQSPDIIENKESYSVLYELGERVYGCNYANFGALLLKLQEFFRNDWLLGPQSKSLLECVRLKVYRQLFMCYVSVSIPSVAGLFGIPEEILEEDVRKFVLSYDLNCRIDRVARVLYRTEVDQNAATKKKILERTDYLMDLIQKTANSLRN